MLAASLGLSAAPLHCRRQKRLHRPVRASAENKNLVPLHAGSWVLVLGDGDFSFSAALARLNSSQQAGCAHITASSLDSRAAVIVKYSGARANLDELARDAHVTVLHEVDATELRDEGLFDTIVFNFPYPPDVERVGGNEGAALVSSFLRCVCNVLAQGGQIRLLMAKGQGGSSRDLKSCARSWHVEELARMHGFEVLEVLPFLCTLATYQSEPSRTNLSRSTERVCTS